MEQIKPPKILEKVNQENVYCPVCFKRGEEQLLFRPAGDFAHYETLPNGREKFVVTKGKRFPYYCICSYRSDRSNEKPITQAEMDYYNKYMKGDGDNVSKKNVQQENY